jgi:hypothetical protein
MRLIKEAIQSLMGTQSQKPGTKSYLEQWGSSEDQIVIYWTTRAHSCIKNYLSKRLPPWYWLSKIRCEKSVKKNECSEFILSKRKHILQLAFQKTVTGKTISKTTCQFISAKCHWVQQITSIGTSGYIGCQGFPSLYVYDRRTATAPTCS